MPKNAQGQIPHPENSRNPNGNCLKNHFMAENLRKSAYLIPDDREEARGAVREVFKQAIKMLGGKPKFSYETAKPYLALKIMTGKSFRSEVGANASNADVDLVTEEITEQPDEVTGFYDRKQKVQIILHTDKGGFVRKEKWEGKQSATPTAAGIERSEPDRKELENLLERLKDVENVNRKEESAKPLLAPEDEKAREARKAQKAAFDIWKKGREFLKDKNFCYLQSPKDSEFSSIWISGKIKADGSGKSKGIDMVIYREKYIPDEKGVPIKLKQAITFRDVLCNEGDVESNIGPAEGLMQMHKMKVEELQELLKFVNGLKEKEPVKEAATQKQATA